MADGDADAGTAAAAAGLPVMTGTEKVQLGWRYINTTRDLIAQLAAGIRSIATGGTGASTAASARSNLGAAAQTDMTAAQTNITALQTKTATAKALGAVSNLSAPGNDIKLSWESSLLIARVDSTEIWRSAALAGDSIAGTAWVNSQITGKRDETDGNFGSTPILTPNGRATPVTTSYVAAYLNSDGRIGASASSRALKNDHGVYAIPDNWRQLQAVLFDFKDDPEHVVRLGMYAEDTNDVEPLLVEHQDGQPHGVHYEQALPSLLLEVCKQQADLIDALTARVTALEDKQ